MGAALRRIWRIDWKCLLSTIVKYYNIAIKKHLRNPEESYLGWLSCYTACQQMKICIIWDVLMTQSLGVFVTKRQPKARHQESLRKKIHTLAYEVARAICPMYERISDPQSSEENASWLNSKCQWNATIWARCPKTTFVGATYCMSNQLCHSSVKAQLTSPRWWNISMLFHQLFWKSTKRKNKKRYVGKQIVQPSLHQRGKDKNMCRQKC